MKCPECKAWTEVSLNRQQQAGYIRWRLCANGHKFKTVETPVKASAHGGARKKAA